MKLKSLFLGSAAALALTSGALAADPRSSFVSLDVCDAYGITGLTIASADTCLKISGSVSYEFHWGNYRGYQNPPGTAVNTPWASPAAGARNLDRASSGSFLIPGAVPATGILSGENDWRSRLETILSFEATTQTDAGAAKAHITLRERNYFDTTNNVPQGGSLNTATGAWTGHTGTDAHALRVNDAWVSFGDTTVLMAGKKSSIAKFGDDEPFNFLGLANSQSVEHGVMWSYDDAAPNHLRTGGHVIQVVSEVADGVSVGVGLESLDGIAGVDTGTIVSGNSAGTLVGFVEAKGAWGQAHATLAVGNILTDVPNAIRPWGLHTGGTFNFDAFKVRAALATDNTGYWNALLSGEAAFDLFTLAASAEFINTGNNPAFSGGLGSAATATAAAVPARAQVLTPNENQLGLGVSAGFQATETIKINAGFRYFDANTATPLNEGWQAALQLVASLTDTIEATGEVGVYGGEVIRTNPTFAGDTVGYANLGVTYKPGGNFETGAGLEVNSIGAYKLKFNAKKTF